jgi:putative transposase
MPRRARLVFPDIPMHIIQRGNNRGNCFFTSSDYKVYLDMLRSSAVGANCRIHAYVLMSNHVHILASPATEHAAGSMMKAVGERYVQYVNRHYARAGTLWQGRFRSCLVQDETYLLVCHRYIELNPVRAGMVEHPSLYPWSSHRCNADGHVDPLITPHPVFSQLGSDDFSRALSYRALFTEALSTEQMAQLRDATNYNYAFGNKQFSEDLAHKLGKQVTRVLSPPHHSII